MQPIHWDKLCYRIGGKPIYLYSGEFHYFRVPRSDWRRRMDLFREAGGNCLGTYVPWLLHEPQEGEFCFESADGHLNLEEFLQTAQEAGLYVLARPGPYQYSELQYDGLPGWLCENYPELLARDLQGKSFRRSSVSYLHPLFLDKVRAWFAQVAPRLARYTVSRGGPIALTQLDNELAGIHVWFGGLDYHEITMGLGQADGRYPRFLQQRYGTLAALNRAYETAFLAFEAVNPITPAAGGGTAAMRRAKDYFEFYLGTIAEFAQTLAALLRQHGIDTPLIHNSANPVMNAYFLETVQAMGDDFLLGSDHYYSLGQDWPQNNPTPRYAIEVFYSHEMLRLLGYPPTVLELPGGSAADWPPITAHDARACYLTNIAEGMKGSNFYVFTGGPNPPLAGNMGDVYDYNAAISAEGVVRPLYDVQAEVGRFLGERPWLVEAQRDTDCRLTLDWDLARASHYEHGRGEFLLSGSEAWDFTRKGFLTTAFCAGLSPAFVDLNRDDWLSDTATPLLVATAARMAAAKQERLKRFLQAGGKMLLAPVLPTHDETGLPCTILRDFLGGAVQRRAPREPARLTVANLPNLPHSGEVFFVDALPDGANILGVDEFAGQPFAWEQHLADGGAIVVLGWGWSHTVKRQEQMLTHLLARLGLQQRVWCSNSNVWTALRTTGTRSILFLMNLFSSPAEATVRCRPSWSPTMVDLGTHHLAPMTVQWFELQPEQASEA